MRATVVVIGAGLAGLRAAQLLDAAGVDYLLVEARDRPGGRILTVDADGAPGGVFDLGPSWYWPAMQPAMGALVDELGLSAFEQYAQGDMVVERARGQPTQRFRGYAQSPASMRLVGGTGALVRALAERLPAERLLYGTRVTALHLAREGVELAIEQAAGVGRIVAQYVIAALPPRLLAAQVRFDPPLADATARRWHNTATWMAPHAKLVALYDRPFWRDAGLSGDAQSAIGPMVEIHDASAAESNAALFGFVGLPAAHRRAVGEVALKRAGVDQLVRLFGEEARSPRAVLLKDWAADPLTAIADDQQAAGHPLPDTAPWVEGAWQAKLALAGSETSAIDSGYLSGAVVAAEATVRETLAIIATGGR
jgi:monoamine oxidase